MAKLPTYERQAVLMNDIGQIQTPNLQESIRRSQSIQGGLDVISKFAAEQAEREVTKKAAEYTVANPLTAKQLEEAQTTGVNPIEAALNGGMVWNDALQKLYAQQASTELTNVAYKHYESVYDRVKSGELSDPAVIQQQLETPLKSWSGVIAQIDPQEANAFYQRRITDGNTYYKASLKEVRAKEQVRQDAIAQDTMYGLVKQFELDLENQEPSVVFAKYVNGMKEANGLFQNSPNKATYKSKIEKEFTTALLRNIAIGVQGEYGTVDEALERLDKNDLGKYSEVWKNLTPSQKDTLQTEIVKRYNKIDTQSRATLKGMTDAGKDIRDAIIDGANPDDYITDLTKYNTQGTSLSGEYAQAAEADKQLTEAVINISDTFKGMTSKEMEIEISKIENNAIKKLAITHRDKLIANRNKDLAAFALSRSDVDPADIGLLFQPDTAKTKVAFEDQLSLITSHPDYVSGQTNVLTTAQTTYLVNYLSSEEGQLNKEYIAGNIVKTFGANSFSIFNQIADKDPVFAQIGILTAEDMVGNAPVIKGIIDGQRLDIKVDNARKKTEVYREIMNTIGETNPKEANSILAAADAYYASIAGPEDIQYFKEDLYLESLNAVVGAKGENGGFTTVNGSLTLLDNNIPRSEVVDYIRSSTIADFIAASTIDSLAVGGTEILDPEGRPYPLQDLRNAEFRKVDNGYKLLLGGREFKVLDPSTGNVEALVVDLNVLQQIRASKKLHGNLSNAGNIPLDINNPYYGVFQ